MSPERSEIEDSAKALREAFDRSFAAPRSGAAAPDEQLLAIRVAGLPYAFRIVDLAGLAANRPIVPVPGPIREAVGLTGIRGELVAVYNLALLLGHAGGGGTRWLALHLAGELVALAFGELEGQIRVPGSDLLAADGRSEHIRQIVRLPDGARAILDAGSICKAIRRRCDQARASKER